MKKQITGTVKNRVRGRLCQAWGIFWDKSHRPGCPIADEIIRYWTCGARVLVDSTF